MTASINNFSKKFCCADEQRNEALAGGIRGVKGGGLPNQEMLEHACMLMECSSKKEERLWEKADK